MRDEEGMGGEKEIGTVGRDGWCEPGGHRQREKKVWKGCRTDPFMGRTSGTDGKWVRDFIS